MRNSTKNIIGVVKSPIGTFRNILKSERNLSIPLVINLSILLVAILPTLTEGITEINKIPALLMIATSRWVIIAAIYFEISEFLRGKGNYFKMLELLGYARVPALIGYTVTLPLALFMRSQSFEWVLLLFNLWSLVLDIIAVREVNEFSIKRALVVVTMSVILVSLLSPVIYFGSLLSL